MTKTKAVLDTNIYLSGIIFGGNSRHILDLAIIKKIEIVTSPSILLEIASKLEAKFGWEKDQIITVVKSISKTAIVVNPQKKLYVIKRDKSDNKIIEAAVEANAVIIVTGDKDLLDIKKYQDIQIISPGEFLSKYIKI